MEVVILILLFKGDGVTSIEFSTMEACQAALVEVTAKRGGTPYLARGWCVEKG